MGVRTSVDVGRAGVRWKVGVAVLTVGLLSGMTAVPVAAQEPPSGFCIGADFNPRPANPDDCTAGERFLTPEEKAQLEGTLADAEALNDLGDEFGELGDPSVIPDAIPAGWYQSVAPCTSLPSTNVGGDNQILSVYIARTFELVAQIAYDIASNELTGISGAITGAILGATRVPVFALEWVYDVQDECQEIVHRNVVLTNLDTPVSTRASQSSLDALNTQLTLHDTQVQNRLGAISDALAAHDAKITTLISDHDTNVTNLVNDHDTNVTNLVNDHDTNVTNLVNDHDANMVAETDELDTSVAGSRDENVRFFIEDHLDTCRALTSLLLSEANGGYADKTFEVVDAMIAGAEADGLNIGKAQRFFDTGVQNAAAGDARKAFKSLCSAYGQLANGN